MRVGAVVLAAGASSRLGESKQLVILGGERLLARAVRVATEAGCEPVVVVLGAHAERIAAACELSGVTVVRNDSWAEGMASSIRAGIGSLASQVEAVVVMGCDQPAVTGEHLRALISMSASGNRLEGVGGTNTHRPAAVAVASAYAGKRGIPACFPADGFAELMQLRGDKGARDLLETARAVELPGGELDVDTVEMLAEARARYGWDGEDGRAG